MNANERQMVLQLLLYLAKSRGFAKRVFYKGNPFIDSRVELVIPSELTLDSSAVSIGFVSISYFNKLKSGNIKLIQYDSVA